MGEEELLTHMASCRKTMLKCWTTKMPQTSAFSSAKRKLDDFDE